jgi:hypothetical protein
VIADLVRCVEVVSTKRCGHRSTATSAATGSSQAKKGKLGVNISERNIRSKAQNDDRHWSPQRVRAIPADASDAGLEHEFVIQPNNRSLACPLLDSRANAPAGTFHDELRHRVMGTLHRLFVETLSHAHLCWQRRLALAAKLSAFPRGSPPCLAGRREAIVTG